MKPNIVLESQARGGPMMELEAIYERGKLEFLTPVKFTHERFPVRVEIPERMIVRPSMDGTDAGDPGDYARELVARLDAIRNLPIPPDETLPGFSQKQQERLDAFALRDAIRKER